jgi:hypothetical protein
MLAQAIVLSRPFQNRLSELVSQERVVGLAAGRGARRGNHCATAIAASGILSLVIAVYVLVTASTVLSVVLVLALFFWTARKDGETDRAVRGQSGRRR